MAATGYSFYGRICIFRECTCVFVLSTGTRGLGPNVMATLRTRWLLSILLFSLPHCFATAGRFIQASAYSSVTVGVQLLFLGACTMRVYVFSYFYTLTKYIYKVCYNY